MQDLYSSGELKILKWICNKVVYYNTSLVGVFLNKRFDHNSREEHVTIEWEQNGINWKEKKGRCLCLQLVLDNV